MSLANPPLMWICIQNLTLEPMSYQNDHKARKRRAQINEIFRCLWIVLILIYLINFFWTGNIFAGLKFQRHRKVDSKHCPSNPCPLLTNFPSPEVFHSKKIHTHTYMRIFFSPISIWWAAYVYTILLYTFISFTSDHISWNSSCLSTPRGAPTFFYSRTVSHCMTMPNFV